MPKTWAKSYEWIFNQKTNLENDYKKLEEKVKEIEEQHDEYLGKIAENINKSRKELQDEHDIILEETKKVKD